MGHTEKLLFSCLGLKVTVYSRKLQCFFWDILITLTCEFRGHRAGSQLKTDQLQANIWANWAIGMKSK